MWDSGEVGQIAAWSAEEVGEGKARKKFVLESLGGFDLIPQMSHVESVAVLGLVSEM